MILSSLILPVTGVSSLILPSPTKRSALVVTNKLSFQHGTYAPKQPSYWGSTVVGSTEVFNENGLCISIRLS